jgi:hypothetical protein
MKFLVRRFPKPDFVFLLDVDLNVLAKRRKDVTKENLAGQKKRYLDLGKLLVKSSFTKLNNTKNFKKNQDFIMDLIWKRMFQKLKF